MRRLLNWIRSWFATASVVRQLSGQKELLGRLELAAHEHAGRLERKAKLLNAAIEKVTTEIEDAHRIHRRYEFALEDLREQNAVLEKTIQTLVASHELLISQIDAQTSIAVRARVAASTRE